MSYNTRSRARALVLITSSIKARETKKKWDELWSALHWLSFTLGWFYFGFHASITIEALLYVIRAWIEWMEAVDNESIR